MHKWSGYFDAYHRHFKRFRARRKVVLVEIGVQSGGSIDMWQAYFGPNRLEYHGVDFNPEVVKFQGPGVHIHIGDQANRTFWRAFRRSVPPPDIVIDDGGHKMVQQRVAFEEELLHLKEGGMYLCEDLHTSYMADYGGAYRKNGTMVEYLKGLVDSLNAFQSEEDHFKIDAFSARIRAIYFYASMAFVYKKATEAMEASEYGTEFIEYGLGGNVEEPEDPGEMEVPEE
ncbi:S-adenosyl-L-methionine-dependent methyltransferase [Hyaloraphidium curvatum]|nr:S-adenosyl-L-methionine-dependent methyltransferase [Hyaloraphidium curvatum]